MKNTRLIEAKNVLLSAGIWTAFILLTILVFLVMTFFTLLLYPFDRQRRVPHRQCYWWASAIVRLNPYWRLHVSGLENIDPRQTYVIVTNHQSMADIIVLYKTKVQFKWVAKDSLFKLPLVGWCMKLAKHIELSRGHYSSIKKTYRTAEQWLRSGMSVLFFPEGTRSVSEEMNEFQNGAFKLALKEKKPILPIVIEGTRNALPKGSWIFSARVNGSLKVLKPIDTDLFELREFDRLKNIVRSEILENRKEINLSQALDF